MNFQHDEEHRQHLLRRADDFAEELLRHRVLRHYREEIAIVLKGSTAHGYSDRYSDVDIVLYAAAPVRAQILSDYVSEGLSRRADGLLLPLNDWEGHYQLDSLDLLAPELGVSQVSALWECLRYRLLHDPYNRLASRIKAMEAAFRDNLEALTRNKYLDCQLQLLSLIHISEPTRRS